MNSNIEMVNNERLEIDLLIEAIFRKYGYDFRHYSRAHIKRRLEHRKGQDDFNNYSEMMHNLIHDESFFNTLLLDLSINVTEMFRDPWVYVKMRDLVVPHLRTYPFINVWHAGCSTGQEVYSMVILLEEEGLKERTQIYATDFNEQVLAKAKDGIYPTEFIREYTHNYQMAGGKASFSDYYTAKYDKAIINQSLKNKILFSSHNLVTDGVFGEMNLIFCRNVLIYFERDLQNRVLNLFYDSLCPGGFLCLGSKESIKFSSVADKFEPVADKEKIFRKKQ